MKIGYNIKKLRLAKGLTQEDFANRLGISVQTVSRWETLSNYPDLSMLPILASFFGVTTDYLLGMKGENTMVKLVRTVEIFELENKKEADKLLMKFKGETFPIMKDYKISNTNGAIILEVTKEFNSDIENMNFE